MFVPSCEVSHCPGAWGHVITSAFCICVFCSPHDLYIRRGHCSVAYCFCWLLDSYGSRGGWRGQVSNAGFASPSASVCRLDEELLFLGSWTGDSLLVRTVPEVRLGHTWQLWTVTNTVDV